MIISDSRRRALLCLGASVLTFALAGCEGSVPSSTYAKNPNDPELFTIPQEQMSHVQVLTVQPTTLSRTLRLTGAVAYNNFRTTPVITQVSGPVSRIVVVPGQHVKQGEPMLYVSSPDYSQLRTNYLKAKDAYALKAPPTFEVPVKAPINGEVVEQDVSAGQLLQTGTTQCFMLSDTSTVWVLVNIYQKDLPYVRVGDSVGIQTETYPQVFHGRISYVAAALDPSTRTLQARIETSNPGEKLKKDMYVVATVNAGKISNAIALPDAAVLRDSENQPFVYAAVASNQFGRRPVTLGESLNGQTEITSGLRPGDHVIGNGSLFLQFANSLQR
jgi:cobalt-zinc-cadmium efflux system membrane fusion protein